MNYEKIYNQIINHAKLRNLPNKKTRGFERHHIIPRSLNGTNDKNNLVDLTPREHFICHRLLVFIHKNDKLAFSKMISALHFMIYFRKSYSKLTSISYERIKLQQSKNQSEFMKGKQFALGYKFSQEQNEANRQRNLHNEYGKGYKPTEEQKRNRKTTWKNRTQKQIEEFSEKCSQRNIERYKNPQARERISNSGKGKKKPGTSYALKKRFAILRKLRGCSRPGDEMFY